MATARVSFELTLPNRGCRFGATTAAEMLELAETTEASGAFDSVWVGDSIMAKPRLEAVALLAAVAARTRPVRLRPACFASFPLRHPVLLAHQCGEPRPRLGRANHHGRLHERGWQGSRG